MSQSDTMTMPERHAEFKIKPSSAVKEHTDLKKLKRQNSAFAAKNIIAMVSSLRHIRELYVTNLVGHILIGTLIAMGASALLPHLGVNLPYPFIWGVSFTPAFLMFGLFLFSGSDTDMKAKRDGIQNARRVVQNVGSEKTVVLTADHIEARVRLDSIFQPHWGGKGMTEDERKHNSDAIFALMLDNFAVSEEILRIVETRQAYTIEEVSELFHDMRDSPKPLMDGAL